MIPYTEEAKRANLEEESNGFDSQYYDKEKQIKWFDRVLLHRPSKVIFALCFAAIVIPVLLYQFVLSSTLDAAPSDGYTFGSCLLPRTSRIPCGYGNIAEEQCHPQCCYDLSNHVCYQRLPSRFSYILDRSWSEEIDLHPRIANEPFSFQPSIQTIRMSIDEISKTHLTLSFYNTEDVEAKQGNRLNDTDYAYEVSSPELNVKVDSIRGPIFSTMRGPLIAAEDIWEITFRLTNETMFGLGEIPLQPNTVKVLYNHRNGLSGVPLIFAKSNGSYHGVLIDVPAPTEVSILMENQILVRSITSMGLKFHLFVGPEPRDVMRDVMNVLGFDNHLQYWMLGAHVCNSMREDTPQESLEKLWQFIADAESEGFPYESHCGTGPVIFEDGGHDDVIREGAGAIKEAGKRYVPHVAPYVKYNAKNETTDGRTLSTFQELYLHDPNSSELYLGSAHGLHVVYPDYENVTSQTLIDHLWGSKALADGIVLEDTWPLDDSLKLVNETYLYLPYFNKEFEATFNLTPQWNATKPNGERYLYSHNKYGNNFYSTVNNVTGGNKPIWTSSHWMNGEAVINRQDIDASWTNLRKELVEASLGGVSGQWFWSSPVCGDTEHFSNERQSILCVNWYKAATYLPLVKIHSAEVERHPMAFLGNNRAYMLDAIKKRLSLLPYFFTTLQEGPLLRPMFYQFPQAEILQDMTSQFSVGEDLLVVPDLLPSQSHVNVWMPPGTWYELWSGLKIAGDEGEPVAMSSTDADILTLIRGGAAIFLHKTVHLTAEETRRNSGYKLVIALDNSHNQSSAFQSETVKGRADGKVFVTKDLQLHVTADSEKLTLSHEGSRFEAICGEERISTNVIDEISVYGLPEELNNYDHHREIVAAIDLCALESEDVIIFYYV